MKYYIEAIEQTIKDGGYNEYTTVDKYDGDNLNFVKSKYYKKLSDVSNDIGKNHTYMNIRIINSYGVEIDKETIGSYVDESILTNTPEE